MVFAPATSQSDEPAVAAVDELFSNDMFMPDDVGLDGGDDSRSEASMSSFGAGTPRLAGHDGAGAM